METANVITNSLESAKRCCSLPLTADKFSRIKDRITKACQQYIIGKYCEKEKGNREFGETIHQLHMRLARDFGCSEPTIRRFVSYAKAIDTLQEIVPDIISDMMTEKLVISVENTRILSKRRLPGILLAIEQVKAGKLSVYEIFPERTSKLQKETLKKNRRLKLPKVTIKDTPKYDPDAQVAGLTYTIPSWVSAIDRIFMSENLREISKTARNKLTTQLSELKDIADAMRAILKEER